MIKDYYLWMISLNSQYQMLYLGLRIDEYLIKPESHGWKNIKSRVMFLQAELHIISGENCGTSVTIIMNHF